MLTIARHTVYCCLVILLCLTACNDSATDSTTSAPEPDLPELLQKGLKAHGGLEKWQSMKSMQYAVERAGAAEQHLIDLPSRKVLLTHPNYRLGFDGKEVWVSPNKAAFGDGSARFYHNLRFYFISMPFIVADPGIHYEELPQRQMDGKTYDALRITYDDGVGDASEDEYILHFDPQTHQMEWLLYTVTYYSGEPGSKYNALHYSEWQEVNGLRLPLKMEGYQFAADTIGDKRYERLVNDLRLSVEPVDATQFMMPAGAEIDSLLKH